MMIRKSETIYLESSFMNMTIRHAITRRYVLITCLVFLIGPLSAILAAAQTSTDQEKAATGQVTDTTPLAIKKSTSQFEYQIEGRPDPFLPFVTERSTRNDNSDEIVDENLQLTGMQLFEPGQLTLVALLVTEGDRLAMVQDFTGKGYIIKEGIKIGRRGVVADIIDNKVIIEETARTRGGKTLTNQIAMVLKKEGEE